MGRDGRPIVFDSVDRGYLKYTQCEQNALCTNGGDSFSVLGRSFVRDSLGAYHLEGTVQYNVIDPVCPVLVLITSPLRKCMTQLRFQIS